ncbi:MAG: Ig-like domain-containing protein [Erysipelotrichaceae bacterium]|nr:Ig-like domain-containing protein [Erysipelotrichaceae bacterium]
MKRVMTLLLSVTLLFTSFFVYTPYLAKAEEDVETTEVTEVLPQEENDPAEDVLASEETTEGETLDLNADETQGTREGELLDPPVLLVNEAENGDIYVTCDPDAQGFDYEDAVAYLELLGNEGEVWIRDEEEPDTSTELDFKSFEEDKVIIPNSSLLDRYFLNGIHHLWFSVEGYEDTGYYELTLTKACDPAPENVTFTEDENGVFTLRVEEEDKEWLAKVYAGKTNPSINGSDGWEGYLVFFDEQMQRKTLVNEHNEYSFYQFHLSDDGQELTIVPSAMYYYDRLKNGTYTVQILAKHFTTVFIDEFTVAHGLKQAPVPSAVSVVSENDQIIISCTGEGADEWLNALTEEHVVDQRGSDSSQWSYKEGATISGSSSGGYSIYLMNELDRLDSGDIHDTAYSLKNGSIVVPAEIVRNRKIASGNYELTLSAYMYVPVKVTADITTSIRTDIPDDLAITYDEKTGLIITTSHGDYLDALVRAYDAIGLNLDHMGGFQFNGSELVKKDNSVVLPVDVIANKPYINPEDDYIVILRADGFINYELPDRMHIKAVSTGLVRNITITHPKLVTGNAIIDAEGDAVMTAGKTLQLTAHVEPADAKNKAVVWSSSDTSIATVSSGKVTAKKVTELSEVVITATAKDGSGVSDSVTITVVPLISEIRIIDDSGKDITGTTIGIDPEDTPSFWLSWEISPQAASWDLEWTSSNTKLITVNDWGQVEIVGTKGTAKLTAKAKDGSGKTASITVNVGKLVKSLTITGNAMVATGKSISLDAWIYPEDAANQKLIWSSSDPEVASVKSGKVTAKKGAQGKTVDITAVTTDGSNISDTVTLSVGPVASGVKIFNESYEDITGKTIAIDGVDTPELWVYASVEPEESSQSIIWSSSNTKLATVDDRGYVEIIGSKGTVKITAKTADGSGKSASFTLSISKMTKELRLYGCLLIAEGKSVTLKALFDPEDATNQKLDWKTSDPSIATVKNGKVTAKKGTAGKTVEITATTKDGSSLSYTSEMHVIPPTTKITIYDEYGEDITGKTVGYEIEEGKEYCWFSVVTYPYNTYDLDWSSSNTKVAVIDDNTIKLTGTAGTTKITGKACDGSGKSATVTINVGTNLAKEVEITGTENELKAGQSLTLTARVLPETVANRKIDWYSSDTSIATVKNGKVTASKNVTEISDVIIYAYSNDGGARNAYPVTVYPIASKVNIYDENGDDVTGKTIGVGLDTRELWFTALTDPADASDDVTWSSSNTNLATVEDGHVMLTDSNGTVKITAKAADGSGKSSFVTLNISKLVENITVYNPVDKVMPDGSHAYVSTNAMIAQGQTIALKADVSPEDAANKSLNWYSEDPDVAAVSSKGVVTAKKVDSSQRIFVYAEAKDGSGVKGSYQVRVYPLATAISLLDENWESLPADAVIEIAQTEGRTYQLFFASIPEDAMRRADWKSSNTAIATVGKRGLVTFTGVAGTVKITATIADGSGKSASVTFINKEDPHYDVVFLADSSSMDSGNNKAIYDGVKKYCENNSLLYSYLQLPSGLSDESAIHESLIAQAVEYDSKVIVVDTSIWDAALVKSISKYPDLKIVFLDADDLYDIDYNNDGIDDSIEQQDNLAMLRIAEQDAGFMAGYAAVKDGYRNLGFIGAWTIPEITRYGFGFLEGAEAAAADLNLEEKSVSMKFHYAWAWSSSDDLKNYASGWYENGTEVIFAYPNALNTSIVNAAREGENRKVIGSGSDEYFTRAAEGEEFEPSIITSVMKDYESLVCNTLAAAFAGGSEWAFYTENGLQNVGAAQNAVMLAPYREVNWNRLSKTEYEALLNKTSVAHNTIPTEVDANNGMPTKEYYYLDLQTN